MTRPFRTRVRLPESSDGFLSLSTAKTLEELIGNSRDFFSSRHKQESADEFIAWVALLHASKPWCRQFKGLLAPLLYRALQDADSEGVVWTPILDILAAEYTWIEMHDTAEESHRLPTATERARLLIPWIQAQENPENLEELLEFRATEIWSLVARHAKVFSWPLFERLLQNPHVLQALADNPALSDEQRERLVLTMITCWREEFAVMRAASQASAPAHRFLQIKNSLQSVAAHPAGLPLRARDVLFSLSEGEAFSRIDVWDVLLKDPNLSVDELSKLARQIALVPYYYRAGQWIAELVLRPQLPAEDREWLLQTACSSQNVAFAFLAREDLPGELVSRIGKDNCFDVDVVLKAIKHHAAPIEFLRWCINHTSSPRIRDAIASIETARRDPEIRSRLLKSRSTEVLEQLLQDASGEEYVFIFKKLAAANPRLLLTTIKARGIPEGVEIPRSRLAPLFALGGHEALQTMLILSEYADRFVDDEPVQKKSRRMER